MHEKEAIKLLIKFEYEEKIKNEWNKQNFVDFLLEELADLRIKQANVTLSDGRLSVGE